MPEYVLVESRDPFESSDFRHFLRLAADLAEEKHKVSVFLVQDGVFAARAGLSDPSLERLSGAGVEILADDFSLRERGIARNRLDPRVSPAPLGRLVDFLSEGRRALWH
jgi:sulfur relay (sulfurtransferase) complex TusBCD TusD component (DsrE family)